MEEMNTVMENAPEIVEEVTEAATKVSKGHIKYILEGAGVVGLVALTVCGIGYGYKKLKNRKEYVNDSDELQEIINPVESEK